MVEYRALFDAASAVLLLATALIGAYIPRYLAARSASGHGGGATSLAFHLGNMLSGGVMLSAGFCHLLADSLRHAGFIGRFPLATFLAALGFLVTLTADQVVQYITEGSADGKQQEQQAYHQLPLDEARPRPHQHLQAAHLEPPQQQQARALQQLAYGANGGVELGPPRVLHSPFSQGSDEGGDGVAPRGGGGSGSPRAGLHGEGARKPRGEGAEPLLPLSVPPSVPLGGAHGGGGGGGRSTSQLLHPEVATEAGAVGRTAMQLEVEVMRSGGGGGGDGGCAHGHATHVKVLLGQRQLSFATAVLLALALCIHSVLEGVALGAQRSMRSTQDIMVAIAAHKGLAAYALGASIVESKASATKFWVVIGLFASATPIGIGVGFIFSAAGPGIMASAMSALASGTFLYVAMMEVIPKELEPPVQHRLLKMGALLIGFGLMSLLAVWA